MNSHPGSVKISQYRVFRSFSILIYLLYITHKTVVIDECVLYLEFNESRFRSD